MTHTPEQVEAAARAIEKLHRLSGYATYNELACAALAAAEAVGWRPMSEAPKDKTPLLMFNGRRIDIAAYRKPHFGNDIMWYDECGEPIEPPPTHWMSLPSPPQGQQSEDR